MTKKIVTLFIRDTSINLLEMKGMRVQKWASSPLEAGLVSQGVIQDEEQVAAQVRELFRLEKVTTRKVIAGLSGLNSLYRLITMPELPGAILDEAVKHEAGRVMPVSLDEVYLSYQPTAAPKGEMRVFLAAYPRDGADTLVRTLRKAGLEPYLMDLAPLALCRIPNEPRAIIVNARSEHLTIMVITERLPQLIRWLQLPGEAESLTEKLPAVTEELSRTVTFYNSSHLESPLDSDVPVFVCGELAEAPDAWPSLVGRLNYNVLALPSPVEQIEGFPANEFMVNIGLALKELLPEDVEAHYSIVNLNTLPEIYLPKAFPISRILVPVGVTIGVAVLVYLGLLVQNTMADTKVLDSQLNAMQRSITQQRQEITSIKEQTVQTQNEINPVRTQINQVKAKTGIFQSTATGLEQVREKVDQDLEKIASLAPADIALLYGGDKIEMGGQRAGQGQVGHNVDEASITGIAPGNEGYKAIFEYAKALRNSGRFSMVIISSIRAYETGEDEDYKQGFNFAFTVE